MIASSAFLMMVVAQVAPARRAEVETDDLVLTQLAGVVLDTDRKPIIGASVELAGTRGYYTGRKDSPVPEKGTSDANGRYRLGFYTKRGGKVEVLGVWTEAKGYVRSVVRFEAAKPVMKPGETTEINLELTPGEVLAGTVVCHRPLSARLFGGKQEDERYTFRVRGKSFSPSSLYDTEPGGAFEIWVPKGVYDLELIFDGQTTAATVKGAASGTRGLKLVKVDPPVAPDVVAHAFDALSDDMEKNYSYLELKKIDWPALKTKYRVRAVAARTLPEFVDVLSEMLGELDDGHIWFTEPEGAVVARRPREWTYNGNEQATEATLVGATVIGSDFAHLGTTKQDGFGVVRVIRQSRADDEAVGLVVKFIRDRADIPGFLIDLRASDGGSELVAREIAGKFCAADTVYAKSKFRDGPKPGDFGPTYERILKASAEPYRKPVVCILGPGCVSSGEGFAQMMRCLPSVTTMGLATRGSSGNPGPFKLPGVAVEVMYSRWVDMMPDGTPIEGRGVRPEIEVNLAERAYEDADPTWAEAEALLRAKVNAKK